MNPFLISFSVLFLAEVADKTQLLALYLSSKYDFKKIIPAIVITILILKLAQSLIGFYIGGITPGSWLPIASGLFFIAIGFLIIIEREGHERFNFTKKPRHLILFVFLAYFMAELGDKSEISTILLAAKYRQVIPVAFGTALGMIMADLIAVFAGLVLKKKMPSHLIKYISGAAFLLIGLLMIYGKQSIFHLNL